MLLFTRIYSRTKYGLGLISILAFFQYWQHILSERVVIYNHNTYADDGLLITWSSDKINTCSGGADKPSLRFDIQNSGLIYKLWCSILKMIHFILGLVYITIFVVCGVMLL